jgi:uncharacterized membrane protein
LLIGLIVFLGAHSSRIFAEGWRARFIASKLAHEWRGRASTPSSRIAGFVMIVVLGYGQARARSGAPLESAGLPCGTWRRC